MYLEHGRLRIEIDERTGSLVAVSDTVAGRTLFDGRSDAARLGRLFRVIAPIERWSSHAANSWESGPPDIERAGDGAIIRYADLRSAHGPLGVAAEVEIGPGGPSELTVTLRLESHRQLGDITDVLFPWLGGWVPRGEGSIVLGGVRAIPMSHFPVNRGMTFSRWHQREYFTYPIDLYAPWLDISGTDGGLGLVSYQRSARSLGAFIENLAGYARGLDLSVGFNHYLQLRDGESWTSPPVGISVRDADWHATADRYTTWVDTWFTPPSTPDWARRSIGFQNVLFRGFDGTPIRPLDTIPEVAAAGVAAGVPHLSVWDYVLLGEYAKLSDVPLHGFAARDRQVLVAALVKAREGGARLSSLQNHRLVKPTSALYRDGAEAELCRRYDGTPFVEEYSGSLAHALVITNHVGPMVHPVDSRIETVRTRVLDMIRDSLDLGFDSHFYDQPFENWPSYHPARGDDGPDGAHVGTVSLLKDVRDLLTARSPEGIMIGEYCDVFAAEAIDLWMSWYTERMDLQRSVYSIPQTLQSWVVDVDPAAAAWAFTIGVQLCLTTHGGESDLGEEPAFARDVASLAGLRARADRVSFGRFRDREGLMLDADGPIAVGAFRSADGGAIVIGATGEAGRARVQIDRARWPASAAVARVLRLDGTTHAAEGDDLDLALAANEVAVWYV